MLRGRFRSLRRLSATSGSASACPRITNLLKRLFLEERRGTKTLPNAFGEKAVHKLMYAALERASPTWQRVVITDFEGKQLETIREDINGEFDQKRQLTKPASYSNFHSRRKT